MAPAHVVLWIASGILFGIFSASIGAHGIAFVALAVSLCIAGAAKKAPRVAVIMCLISFACGTFYYFLFIRASAAREVIPARAEPFEAIVISEPRFTERSQRFTVRLASPFYGTATVVTRISPEFAYGDLLHITGEVARTEEDPRERYTVLFPSIELVAQDKGNVLRTTLLRFKSRALHEFTHLLPHDEASLMSGITLGARGDFDAELKTQMSRSGTTHLVALSGYNISILALVAFGIFGAFLKRRTAFICVTIIITGFVLMVGGEASVVRAALMGFLVLFAREAGRLYDVRNAILLTALMMAFIDPRILAYDVGFQLSFGSFLGILFLETPMRRMLCLGDTPGILGWRENLATTLAAQSAVMPLLAFTFGTASIASFIANILILGIMPLVMTVGFFLAALGMLWSAAGFLIAPLAGILLKYILGVIALFSLFYTLPGTFFSHTALILCYYAGLVFLGYYFRDGKERQ